MYKRIQLFQKLSSLLTGNKKNVFLLLPQMYHNLADTHPSPTLLPSSKLFFSSHAGEMLKQLPVSRPRILVCHLHLTTPEEVQAFTREAKRILPSCIIILTVTVLNDLSRINNKYAYDFIATIKDLPALIPFLREFNPAWNNQQLKEQIQWRLQHTQQLLLNNPALQTTIAANGIKDTWSANHFGAFNNQ